MYVFHTILSAAKATDGSFQINTGYGLSRFGDHPGAGTLFTYTRNAGPDCPEECISAEGPTDASVDIMVSGETEVHVLIRRSRLILKQNVRVYHGTTHFFALNSKAF